MAGLAIEKTSRILFENISILRDQYWEKAALGGPKWLPRLQAAAGPHKSGEDPHIAGAALDIFLFADQPRDLNVANQLIEVFENLRQKMRWNCVVYNNWEWNEGGVKFPRKGSPSNRHLTHIHIQWGIANINHTGFETDLTEAVSGISDWGKPGSIEGMQPV